MCAFKPISVSPYEVSNRQFVRRVQRRHLYNMDMAKCRPAVVKVQYGAVS